MITWASERDRLLMPGHVFLYSPPVVAIRRMLETGSLGDIYFVTSTRVNLGIHRSDAKGERKSERCALDRLARRLQADFLVGFRDIGRIRHGTLPKLR